MQVCTDILDVLPDGTITRLQLKTEPMAMTICRNDPDKSFMIEKIDAADQEHMEEALEALASHLHESSIYNINIDCVDGSKAILSI